MTRPTILVLLAHADPTEYPGAKSVRARFEDACKGLPARVAVRPFVGPGKGMSAKYDRLTAELRAIAKGGPILPLLRRRYAADVQADHVVLAWWSGGYAMGRGLSDADRDELAAMVALDGLHTGLEADHTASDAGIEWMTEYARRAVDGRCVCWVGHTDVPTPQVGPGAYASTTQTAAELLRLVGPSRSGYRVQAFDLYASPTQEHVAALHGWGPEFLAGAIAQVLEQRAEEPPADTDPTPGGLIKPPETGPHPQFGDLVLDVALEELLAGVREVPPGSNAGGRISSLYLRNCERDGHPLSLPSGDWCAGFATWCVLEATRRVSGPVEPPVRRRVAVRECAADGLATGAWRPKASGYVPRPGDLVIMARIPGESPLRGGRGHVGIFEAPRPDGATFTTIDGNAGVEIARGVRRFDDPNVLGFVAMPRPELRGSLAPAALAVAATLRARADDAVAWVGELV